LPPRLLEFVPLLGRHPACLGLEIVELADPGQSLERPALLQRIAATDHPTRKRRARQVDALAGEDLPLPVQGQGIGVLRTHVHEHTLLGRPIAQLLARLLPDPRRQFPEVVVRGARGRSPRRARVHGRPLEPTIRIARTMASRASRESGGGQVRRSTNGRKRARRRSGAVRCQSTEER
jgi:hypothetical protein